MGEVAQKAPAIYGAIAGVIADVGAVGKDKVNKQQGFKFRSVDDVYNALHPALAKNKVFIVPEILEQTREVVGETRNGAKMTLVICTIKYTFFAEDGSYIESIIIGEALDTGDKATNKAMAIAYKYACFQVFCIPTEEMTDPDAESPEVPAPESGKKSGGSTPGKQQAGTKKQTEPKQRQEEKAEPEPPPATEGATTDRITEAMLNTIRAEQKRTGVTDQVILARKSVKAKKIEEMTVEEFKAIMEIFKRTPDLKREEDNE
ncbi:MAG: ERF family protein [Ruminococcus sp.]|nr:ERF family protein [Ruminococcus sp.]